MKGLALALCTAGMAVCVGCAGLPPKPKRVELKAEAPLADLAEGDGRWPEPDWWKQYQDPTLDVLVDKAIAASPTLAGAHARFESARQSVALAKAAAGPQLGAYADDSRQRLSDNGVFSPQLLGFYWYNQADLGLQASYTFDWWGKQRDQVKAALDEAHASQAERNAAALVLVSSVCDTYFGWQADEARLALAREREATLARQSEVSAQRVRAELESEDDTQRALSALAAARAQMAALDGSARLRVVALAALVGVSAAELPTLDARPLPQVQGRLPDSVRIDLIARRPDIAASRWRVEAAEASRESARAEFFPDVSINGLLGVQSVNLGRLLEYGSRVPAITAAIHLPLFDSGSLKARYGASQAAVEAAVTSYDEAVVEAARDVAAEATTLAQIDAERAQHLVELGAAAKLRASARARVRQGVTDVRAELAATESWIEQRDALLQLDAAALSTDIGLKRALGGGYERTKDNP